MNAIDGKPEPEEPPIIILGIGRSSYYLLKGDEFLDQILLVDGVYPKPIACVHYGSIFDARFDLGDGFSTGSLWGIHPEIVNRLRDTNSLMEIEA